MTSKYRFVKATEARQDKHLTNVTPTGAIWDCANFMACSSEFLAVPWAPMGAVALFRHGAFGKTSSTMPFLFGQSGAVIDLAFNPFNARQLVTASEDCSIWGWNIPEGGITERTDTPAFKLEGHHKKAGILKFHPSADGVLASVSVDSTVKLWDLNTSQAKLSAVPSTEQILSLDFNLDGTLMNFTDKDKKVCVIDARTGNVVSSSHSHAGTKTQRSVWAKRKNLIITTGFSERAASREMKIWDPRNMATALHTSELDKQSAVIMPFFDEDTNLLYLGGKGDGSIRYYELCPTSCDAPVVYANNYLSSEPQKGLACMPKASLDIKGCEVARFFKLCTNKIVPLNLVMPRRSGASEFHNDIFPPTFASVPALSAADYFAGKAAEPLVQDLEAVYKGEKAPVIVGGAPAVANGHSNAEKAKDDDAAAKKVADEATAKKVADEAAAKKVADEAAAKKVADESAAKKAEEEATAQKAEAEAAAAKKAAEEEAAAQKKAEEEAAAKKAEEEAAAKAAEEAAKKWDGTSVPTKEQSEEQAEKVRQLAAELEAAQAILAKMTEISQAN